MSAKNVTEVLEQLEKACQSSLPDSGVLSPIYAALADANTFIHEHAHRIRTFSPPTLRDQFAMVALTALVGRTCKCDDEVEHTIEAAFAYADMALVVREVKVK